MATLPFGARAAARCAQVKTLPPRAGGAAGRAGVKSVRRSLGFENEPAGSPPGRTEKPSRPGGTGGPSARGMLPPRLGSARSRL